MDGEENISQSGEKPASYSIDLPAVSEADQYGQMKQLFDQIAGQRQGLFGRMLINPQASQMLPQTEGAKILAMGKSGMALLGGTAPEFPFAAWAQQHQPAPSANTQVMGKLLNQLQETPQGDPRVQRGIDNFVYSDILNGSLKEGEEKFGGMGNVTRILQGNYRNDSEREWDMNLHRKMTYGVNAANLSKDVKKSIDYIQDQIGKGEMPSEEYLKAVNNYHNTFLDPNIPIDQKIEQTEKLRDKMESYANLEQVGKVFAPEGWKWLTDSVIKRTVDDKGKVVPGAWSDWKIENPQGIDMMPTFKDSVEKMNDYLNRTGNDLGIKNEEKRKEYIANYFLDKSPRSKTETISRDKTTNIHLKEQEKNQPLPTAPQTVKAGGISQDAVYATPLPPKTLALGTISNVISGKTGTNETTTIGQNSKMGGIVMLNTVLAKSSKGGVRIMDKGENTKDKFTMNVPYVTVDVPTSESEKKINANEIKSESEIEYETKYVPLSQAASALIASYPKDEQAAIRATINQYLKKADELNDAYAKPEAQDYYKKHYRQSIIEGKETQPSAGFTFD